MFLSKTTINILLFLATVILGIGIWIGNAKNNAGIDADNVISNIKSVTITEISILRENVIRAKLEKHGGKWLMSHPIKIDANAFLANKVNNILSRRYSKTFKADKTELHKFGLSPALFTLQLNQHTLSFGDRSDISNLRYIAFNNQVFLIRDQLLPILNGAPASFVSHKLIPNGARITAIELADFSIKQQDNKWLVVSGTSSTKKQSISQDLFIKFVDEWRLSQALYVSLDGDDAAATNAANVIHLADGSQINLFVSKNDSGLIFYRPDPGIYYHMHNEADKNLLNLPVPEPEPEPESSPTP